jgi:hypothetical protein
MQEQYQSRAPVARVGIDLYAPPHGAWCTAGVMPMESLPEAGEPGRRAVYGASRRRLRTLIFNGL